jgi:hypothetical protein
VKTSFEIFCVLAGFFPARKAGSIDLCEMNDVNGRRGFEASDLLILESIFRILGQNRSVMHDSREKVSIACTRSFPQSIKEL